MGSTDVPRLAFPPAPAASDAPAAAGPERAPQVPSQPSETPLLDYGRGGADDGSPRAYERVLAFVDRNRYRLYAALAVLYLLGFNGQWRPEPDSALYLAIGRNLARGEG